MNKKGFTLTELLAVIAIIGIISLIAIPNIVNISENVKKDNMLNDAKRFISLAKAEVNASYDIRNFISNETDSDGNKICDSVNLKCTFYIMDLNKSGDFKTEEFDGKRKIVDPDGLGYDNVSSYVKYYKIGDEVKYCIHLRSEKRFLGKKEINNVSDCDDAKCCVDEENLDLREVVHVK